jgi:hypothetical protein
MRHHRLIHAAALGLAVAAIAAPTAAAQQDLRSPDARDAALSQEPRAGNPWQDLRSPVQDLRSADTRDHAAGRGTFNAPEVVVVKVPQPSPAADGGIEWGDAGIGAAVLFGLLALGGSAAIAHRRRDHRLSHAN